MKIELQKRLMYVPIIHWFVQMFAWDHFLRTNPIPRVKSIKCTLRILLYMLPIFLIWLVMVHLNVSESIFSWLGFIMQYIAGLITNWVVIDEQIRYYAKLDSDKGQ